MTEVAGPLRIALLAYRGKPHCGGQGVYVRHLSRELVRLGHQVEVIGGPPYPVLDEGVALTRLESLDLYREPDPFRVPHLREFTSAVDVLEFALMCTAVFPEPLTFSLRARRHLAGRQGDFDVVHDNQCLGTGLLGIAQQGFPVVATIHHPITVDRDLELARTTGWRKLTLRRWYGFLPMQRRVAPQLTGILTVSESSRHDIARDLGVAPQRITTVPLGVETDVFSPGPAAARVPGRIVTTASADVALKDLATLLEAVAKVRTERDAELVVVGDPKPGGPAERAIDRLGLGGAVRFTGRVSEPELVALLRSAEVAVVPSLYEGFGLPAVEALACGTPLVTTTGGALPEVVGDAALLVAPEDPGALAAAIVRLLGDAALRDVLGERARARALERYSWATTAARTADWYRAMIALDRQQRVRERDRGDHPHGIGTSSRPAPEVHHQC